MSDSSDEGPLEGEDYYTFLNISKNATDDEISNAYRRLSRLYHPDKHQNPERKKEAEMLFSKTKTAYEVLSDGHQRAIYDSLGTAGLATQGWEVVHRTKTPHEIREEYEQLARERAERRLQQRTNPKSSVSMTINATELFTPTDEESTLPDFRDLFGLPHVEISGMSIDQSIEAPLTTKDTAIMSGHLSASNGRGSGHISCSMRRVLSDVSWAEMEVQAGSGLGVAVKGFRTFWRGFSGNLGLQLNVAPRGVKFGSFASLNHQLDKNTVGYLTWKIGSNNGLTTMVTRETETMSGIVSLHFGVPHSYISTTYVYKMTEDKTKFKITGRVSTLGSLLEYTAEKKVSDHSHVSATMSIGVPLGVQLRLRLKRASQTYTSTVILCDELLPAPIVYGTLLPILGWVAVDRLIIKPFMEEQKKQSLARKREASSARLNELKREAAAAVELMRETVKRIVEVEENKKGLVILRAMYGRLVTDGEAEDKGEVIDVTIPVQCLVKNSKLILQDPSKCQLPGFYDPCPTEEKSLMIRYLFHAVTHQVTIKDSEGLRIPKQSHRTDS